MALIGTATMLECCILFMHHRRDQPSLAHLDILRRTNPYPVVALTDEASERIAGSFDAARPEWGYTGNTWLRADSAIYRWFRHGGIRAERYIYFEWDVEATMPVREYFAEVWDADAAASRVERIEDNPCWMWFYNLGDWPAAYRSSAASLSPLNAILLSHRALATLAATSAARPPEVHCEAWLGTALRRAGFEPTRFPPHRAATNDCDAASRIYTPDRPGIYHPIKDR